MVFGITAYVLWGLFPLYWPLLKPAGAMEILAHRIMWSLVAVLAILAVRRNWAWIRGLTLRKLGILAVAAVVITANWGTYIYAVNTGHTIEAALGYFINPLISVLLGVVIFRERLRPWQWVAVGLSVVAVAVLTADYGRLPWIALVLAFSFGTYGLFKKFANMPSAESLAVETTLLFLPALGFALVLQAQGDAAFGHEGGGNMALLAAAGIVTAIPLMLFNAAAVRIPLSTIGMLQYLAPVLQFLIGLLVQHEEMPPSRWAGFLLVWTALIILTTDGVRAGRRTRREARMERITPDPVPESA
ncbi:EamA family transporter RarD [Actinomadura rudentiformis]|uniref:EamA family transporter RarD n=1 Tax=Actinomadura rudentiformis TaxID=359158 RepID=A0A6H9Z699_9ACTN|nr:EamA family transporter RarD [Actinomadura rudentiformis]KAB2350710.1 EamA family transporter RarD [Actinomadura rudentiformis]